MAKTSKPKGSTVALRVLCKDAENANTPVDPTALSLFIRCPDRTTITKAIGDLTREGTGLFLFRLTLEQEGTYHWRWEAEIPNGKGISVGSLDSVRDVEFP